MSDITFGVKPDKEINLASPYVYATDSDGNGGSGGSGGGLFLYHSTNVDEFTKQLDKTWNEIKTALESNLLPINFWSSDGDVQEWGWYFVPFIQHNENGYTVTETSNTVYITDDPDGLPTYIQD